MKVQRLPPNVTRWLPTLLFSLCLFAPTLRAQTAYPCQPPTKSSKNPAPTQSTIAKKLGWVRTDDPANLCSGYFAEPIELVQKPLPGDIQGQTTRISATGVSQLKVDGKSILEGSVIVKQPGRIIKADKAFIYRNQKTGRIDKIELAGGVQLEEHGERIIGQHASIDLLNKTYAIDNVLYHLEQQQNQAKLSSWGTADQSTQGSDGIIRLHKATYSNASPETPAWIIKAKTIKLDRKEGWGTSYHTTLKFFHVPILYFPYYNFPIDARRKSGLLTPAPGHSKQDGYTLTQPIYWNIAPNYDFLLTPKWISTRGIQLNNLFRYLDPFGQGSIYMSELPNDQKFSEFKNNILTTYPNNSTYQPYLNRLNKDSNNRGFLSLQDNTRWNEEWSSNLNINYVTDDYYFQDFNNKYSPGNGAFNNSLSNQLLNQYDLHYSGEHWDFTTLIQAYQSLHPINQPFNNDQYQRLPEFDLNGQYPDEWAGLGFTASAQLVNFGYQNSFNSGQPTGQRLHLRPGINLPLNWASGYLTPEFLLDASSYNVQHLIINQTVTRDREIPIFDLNGGLYFDRFFKMGSHGYQQTLEPSIYYLYVPYENQDQFPIYDTQLQPFTASQLFSPNAFTGFDRIQNANQMSFALNSRILDSETSQQKLSTSIGFINYFTPRKVCLSTTPCAPDSSTISPIVGQITYNPFAHWSTSTSLAWDPNSKQANNGGFGFNYTGDTHEAIGIGYQYVRGTNGNSNSSIVQSGIQWPLSYRWSTVGYMNYNLTQHYPQTYYAGLQYRSCGWSLNFVSTRNYLGTLISGKQYDTSYGLQLSLTGLGSFGGGNNFNSNFENNFMGYQNNF